MSEKPDIIEGSLADQPQEDAAPEQPGSTESESTEEETPKGNTADDITVY